MNKDDFPTVQDLIDKLNDFDTSLPMMYWNNYLELILPMNVDNIRLFGEKEHDRYREIRGSYDRQAVVMDNYD